MRKRQEQPPPSRPPPVVPATVLLLLLLAGARAQERLEADGKNFRVDRAVRRSTYDLAWPLKEPPADKGNGRELSFIFAHRADDVFCRVDVTDAQWRLTQRRSTGERLLASGDTSQPAGTPWREFVLKRRRNRIAGVLDGRLLFRVFESGNGRGTAASWSRPEGLAGEPSCQPVAESDILFRDDFMRTPDDKPEGVWQIRSGRWKLQSYADKWRGDSPLDPMNTARNANPFVYRGSGRPEAVAVAGQPFWDDVSASVSVRSQGGRAGLIFGYRGAKDHYVLWWAPTSLWESASRFALERVCNGERTVLAETSLPAQREQWYRIGVEVRGSTISARLHGTPLLRAVDAACVSGRFGICAADGEVDFDDVAVRASQLRPFQEDWLRQRALPTPSERWEWLAHGVRCRLSKSSEDASLLLGERDWRPQRIAVTVETPKGSFCRVGLSLGAWNAEGLLFVWDSGNRLRAGRRLLVRSAAGDAAVCKARGGYEPGATLRLIADLSDDEVRIYEAQAGLLLRAPRRSVGAGLVGVLARGKGVVTFRDMLIDGPDERDWEQPVKTRVFVKDHYMLDWSAAEGQWVPDPAAADGAPVWWHKGDFFGALELGLPLAAAREDGGAKLFLFARETGTHSGCELAVGRRTPGANELAARLSHRGRTIAQADFIPSPEARELVVRKDGAFLWLQCGKQEPLFAELKPKAVAGTRVGLQLANGELLEGLRLRRDHVVDDQFDQVPTDWRKLGRWEVSNKFHCDPRWGYMVGESDGLAALWRLDSFPGDLTLEFYAGMRYRSEFGFMPYYPRPGDLNAVIASDGTSVFNGYSIVVSGWDTTWTRVLRNGEIVAETRQPCVPSTRRTYPRPQHLHRKWFYVKLRRVGPLLELFFDNEKVLSWRDPNPLGAGRLGLWTYDNSILIARAKISYSRREPFQLAPAPTKAQPPAPTAPPQPARPASLRLTSTTHPGGRFTFDRPGDTEGWGETGDVGDARVAWDPADAGAGGGSLRVTNVNPGGRFLVRVPVKRLDLRRAHHVSFACRMDPGVRVNLYARIAGKRCFVRLTGPGDSDENLQCLGAASIRADGRWRRVSFALGEALLTKRPRDRRLTLQEMQFGVYRGQYLLAGLDGNPAGVSFNLDNFEICSEGPGELKAKVTDADGGSVPKGFFSVWRGDGTEVSADQPFSAGALTRQLDDGEYLIKARAEQGGGEASLRVRAVKAPPAVAAVSPAPGQPWGSQPVTIRFEAGAMLPLWDVVLTVAGKSFYVDDEVLSCDLHERALRFDPVPARMVFQDKQSVRFSLRVRGRPDKTLKEWDVVFERAADAVPPRPVRVKEYMICNTFERDLGSWTRIGQDREGREHGAMLIRDKSTAASGRYSLKLFNELVGGVAGAQITANSLSAGRYPIVSFDCLMDEEVLADLLLTARGMQCRITLTDNEHRNTAYPLGRFTPEFVADGSWRHVEANWREMIARSPFVSNMFSVSHLQLADNGWKGNRQGAAIRIDNFMVARCFSSAGQGFPLNWTASDPGGIAGYSYHWSDQPGGDPDTTSEGTATSARFKDLPEGRMFFHIRPVDEAGNWGAASHWLFLVDNTPPAVKRMFPEPDSESASRTLGVEFADPISGLDPKSLTMTVNGRWLSPGRSGVHVDLGKGLVQVDWVEAGLRPSPPPDGHVFDVTLGPLRDFAGNSAQRLSWKWKFARGRDKRPPLAPEVAWTYGRTLQQLTFERTSGTLSAAAPVWLDRPVDPERGNHVQRVRVGAAGIRAQVTVPGNADVRTHRYLSFRYRFPPGLKIDLTGIVNDPDPEKRRMVMKLTDADVRPDYVTLAGRVEGIVCDDRWRAALVDLKTHVEQREHLKEGETPSTWTVSSLSFADVGFNWQKPNTVFHLDDIVVAGPGPLKAKFSLKAADESGVAGFACAVDRNPDGAPERKVNVPAGALYEAAFPEKGVWYVHACAQDGAGNWSAPGHFTYVAE